MRCHCIPVLLNESLSDMCYRQPRGRSNAAFLLGERMDIFIYSDESGVFDKAHNDYFVFGGLMFFSNQDREINTRKYIKAEDDVKQAVGLCDSEEAKAAFIRPKYRNKLFRSLNNIVRFGVIVEQQRVLDVIFRNKKDRQRYLDYVYKIAVKRCLENLIRKGKIDPAKVNNMRFYVDEHTTATNGKYELRESLEQEFRIGTYNLSYDTHFPPLFRNMQCVTLEYCNSKSVPLIRAADIVANNIFYKARMIPGYSSNDNNLFVIRLP